MAAIPVNRSFRLPSEGLGAVRTTPVNCVQGGDCQLIVSGLSECLFLGGNGKAAPKDRLIPGSIRLQPFEGVVDQVSVNLGGREVPVTQRPLDHARRFYKMRRLGGRSHPLSRCTPQGPRRRLLAAASPSAAP